MKLTSITPSGTVTRRGQGSQSESHFSSGSAAAEVLTFFRAGAYARDKAKKKAKAMDDHPNNLLRGILEELSGIHKVLRAIAMMLAFIVGVGFFVLARAGLLAPWFNSLFGI